MEVEISEDKLINKKLISHRFFTIDLIIEDILGKIKKVLILHWKADFACNSVDSLCFKMLMDKQKENRHNYSLW